MPLENETFTEPVNLKNETLRGRTTLDYDGWHQEPVVWENCVLEGDGRSHPDGGGNYALYVPPERVPLLELRGCDLGHADKVAAVSGVKFTDCEIHHGEDGIFALRNVEVSGGRTYSVGGVMGDHADGFQMAKGSNIFIHDHHFDLDHPDTNACIFLRPQLGQIQDVTITRCRLSGGNFWIYVDEGKFGFPENITIIGCGNTVENYRVGPLRQHAGHRPHQKNNSWNKRTMLDRMLMRRAA